MSEKNPVVLKPPGRDTYSDLQCPYCESELCWREDDLYTYHLEHVQCGECERDFYVKQIVKTTYEVVKEN